MTPLEKAVLHFFDEYVFGFMRSDIHAAIRGEANYLAALGLATYTEVLGGLRTGQLGVQGQGRANFDAFLPYLGRDYEDLVAKGVDLYGWVRCGLVHNYFIKGDATIWMRAQAPCGVIANPDGLTYFIVNVYSSHLFSGGARFRDEILEGADPTLANNFQAGLARVGIHIP